MEGGLTWLVPLAILLALAAVFQTAHGQEAAPDEATLVQAQGSAILLAEERTPAPAALHRQNNPTNMET